MALEDNVKELTLAVLGLTKAIEAQTAAAVGTPDVVKKPEVQKPTTPKASPEKPAHAVAKEEAASTTSTATDVEAEDLTGDVEVTLQQLAEVFTTLVEINRPKAVELLQEYKLAKISAADPSLYGELFQKVTDLVNG